MIKFLNILKNLGYKGNLQHEAEFQMCLETTGELTFYLKLEKHMLSVSIDNEYACVQGGTKVGLFVCKIQE